MTIQEGAPIVEPLTFFPASMMPTKNGHYMVVNELGTYVKCMASFSADDQFQGFYPDFLPDRQIIPSRVLAWARLPTPRDVIKKLHRETTH